MAVVPEALTARRLSFAALALAGSLALGHDENTQQIGELQAAANGPRVEMLTMPQYDDLRPAHRASRQRPLIAQAVRMTPLPSSHPSELYPTDEMFDELVGCEAGGDWRYGGPGGHVDPGYEEFEGGPNFTNQTWRASKPSGYPEHAYQASRRQQIIVARIVQHVQGWDAWPTCSRKLHFRRSGSHKPIK